MEDNSWDIVGSIVGWAVIVTCLGLVWHYSTAWNAIIVAIVMLAVVTVLDLYARVNNLQARLNECQYGTDERMARIFAELGGLSEGGVKTEERLDRHHDTIYYEHDNQLTDLEGELKDIRKGMEETANATGEHLERLDGKIYKLQIKAIDYESALRDLKYRLDSLQYEIDRVNKHIDRR
jgi:chromosome segregation ATPase